MVRKLSRTAGRDVNAAWECCPRLPLTLRDLQDGPNSDDDGDDESGEDDDEDSDEEPELVEMPDEVEAEDEAELTAAIQVGPARRALPPCALPDPLRPWLARRPRSVAGGVMACPREARRGQAGGMSVRERGG